MDQEILPLSFFKSNPQLNEDDRHLCCLLAENLNN